MHLLSLTVNGEKHELEVPANRTLFQLLREDLDLCYAMTVHKAQGSEFDSVALVLPTKDVPILTREVLYTAVSRARRSVVIIGSEEILRLGISRKIERYSGLSEQIRRIILR